MTFFFKFNWNSFIGSYVQTFPLWIPSYVHCQYNSILSRVLELILNKSLDTNVIVPIKGIISVLINQRQICFWFLNVGISIKFVHQRNQWMNFKWIKKHVIYLQHMSWSYIRCTKLWHLCLNQNRFMELKTLQRWCEWRDFLSYIGTSMYIKTDGFITLLLANYFYVYLEFLQTYVTSVVVSNICLASICCIFMLLKSHYD